MQNAPQQFESPFALSSNMPAGSDCCLAFPNNCCLLALQIAACYLYRMLLACQTECSLLLLQIEVPSYIRPAPAAQPTPYPSILHPSHTPASPGMAQLTAPAQVSQPAAPVDAAAPPPLLDPNQGPPPMHDSATGDQLHLRMSQLDRPPSQMDSKTAGSPSALLQAPARAVRPTDVGGSYDKGDQLATEMATVIKSPATAVATFDSEVAGRSHTDLGTTHFPDDDMIEVMPCIYLAICLLPYLLLAMLTSMSCFGFEANCMSAPVCLTLEEAHHVADICCAHWTPREFT